MRDGPPDDIMANGVKWTATVSSWLGDQPLEDDVPLFTGVLEYDVTRQVPERLTFAVPDEVDDVSWVPDAFDHPLNKNGQQLDVQITITSPVTLTDWPVRVARLQIQDWQHDEVAHVVNVEAVGLLQIALDDDFVTPDAPRAGDTFVSAFTRLLPGKLGVQFDPALVDRPLPQSLQWDQGRLDALYSIADAWPARLRTDETGTVQLLPPLPATPVPVAIIKDGEGGTLIGAPRTASRDGIKNILVCRSSATDDPARAPIQAVAQVVGGPLDPTGDYGRAVGVFSTPLVVTYAQCLAAAQTRLKALVIPAQTRAISMAPDPRFEADDALQLEQFDSDGGVTYDLGWVTGYQLPLTVDDGEARLTVGAQVAVTT